jgi:phosphoglycerol transferase MdoB-like AlkP superfamily enzyme
VITEKDFALLTKARAQPLAVATTPQPAPTQEDDFVSQVVKYIPAEIVAAYVTLQGMLTSATSPNSIPSLVGWLVFLGLLVLTPLYTWRFSSVKGLPPPYTQIVIATVGFVVWVFTLGGPFKALSWYNSIYGSILLIFFTLIPPLVIGKAT